ncbi:twin-arginine translocation signal domain-containing protein [Arcobacteraceae bacterium]|nr:twin-arginine translocation signal domain-containing protein [Arcobacteraceae bacterium]
MENSRRNFIKKAAIVTTGAVAGATVMAANSNPSVKQADGNGVVIGKSKKKEILYKHTPAWEEFYKKAK